VDPFDALLRAAVLLVALGLAPVALGALLRWGLAEPAGAIGTSWARLAALPGLLAGAFLVGMTLLPAPYAGGPSDPARIGTALFCCALVGVLGFPRALRPALRAPHGWARPSVAGALVGLGLPLAALATAQITTLAGSPRADGAAEAAARRLLVVPWDPGAHVALGWRDALAGDRARAEVHLAFAQRVGGDEIEALELRAELEAQRGDCAAARRAFAEALERRTARAMAEVLSAPLELADYALPPSLVRVCGLGEALSGP
jgi:hypothetical protein